MVAALRQQTLAAERELRSAQALLDEAAVGVADSLAAASAGKQVLGSNVSVTKLEAVAGQHSPGQSSELSSMLKAWALRGTGAV